MSEHGTAGRFYLYEKIGVTFGRVVILTLAITLFSIAVLPIKDKTEANGPSGLTKRLIVKHSNVLGSDTDTNITDANLNGYIENIDNLNNLPYSILEVDSEGEESLRNSGLFASVFEDKLYEPLFDTPLPSIGADTDTLSFGDTTTSTAYTGDGYAVAVVDTGVDKNHSLLSGKVIHEACFSMNSGSSTSLCPGGAPSATGNNSALDCSTSIPGCGHGTGVAGIVAMPRFLADIDQDSTNEAFGGIARDTNIIAIKVFSQINSSADCGGTAPCIRVSGSSLLSAINYLIDLNVNMPIAAANFSLGGGNAANSHSACKASTDASEYEALALGFASLRNKNIAPVVANGNSGDQPSQRNGVMWPACVENAIAVGATNVTGTSVASYSNNGSLTQFLAPGGDIDGSNLDTAVWIPEAGTSSGLDYTQGTSQAAPLVSGAYALIREKHPNASVNQITELLKSTGTDVVDNRAGYTTGAKKLIKPTLALSSVAKPTISNFTGPSNINENSDTELTFNASTGSTCSINNGVGPTNATSGTITVPGKSSYTLTCKNTLNDSVSATFTTDSFNSAPTKPGGGQPLSIAANLENRSATISWSESTDSDEIEDYEVFLDGQSLGSTSNTSFILTDLGLNHEYTVSIYASDVLGATSEPLTESLILGSTHTPGVPNTGLMNILEGANRTITLSILAVIASGSMLGIFSRTLKTNSRR